MTHEERADALIKGSRGRPIISELVAEFAAVEREALERAAMECDRLGFRSDKIYTSVECATAIRGLKDDT